MTTPASVPTGPDPRRHGPAWLFVPGDRPDRFAKAAERSDVTVVDLEDAVAPGDKAAARTAIRTSATTGVLDPSRTVLRVNGVDTEDFGLDLALLAELSFTHVMVPKASSAASLAPLSEHRVIAIVESAAGALAVEELAAADQVVGLFWGAEDLVAGLGGGSSRHASGAYRDVATHVRSRVLLAAKAHGVWALDAIWAALDDLEGLSAEAADAAESGFDAKLSIHPKLVPVVRAAFRPDPARVEWARGVLGAAAGAAGAFAFEGAMIDEPLLAQARTILARESAANGDDGPGSSGPASGTPRASVGAE